MIKCRQHPFEQGVGVCASCLRERLLALVAAQSGRPHRCCAGTAEHQSSPGAAAGAHPPQLPQKLQHPPSLIFPRSVSPYVSRRLSLNLDDGVDRCRRPPPVRFYSTPQVGPTAARRKPFSIFSSLFGGGHQFFRSEEAEQECGASGASPWSTSWFAALMPGRRKKKRESSRQFPDDGPEEDSVRIGRRERAWCPNRGMSPARGESDGENGSASGSGDSTESTDGWRRPAPTPMWKHVPPANRTVTGFVFCLSPLVRASPRRSHIGEGSGAGGLSGERRGHHCHRRRHAPGGRGPTTVWQNRSRKLADFGRFN